MPLRRDASRSAPIFVRQKTSTGPVRFVAQPRRQPLRLLAGWDRLHGVRNRLRRAAAAPDLHVLRVVQELLRSASALRPASSPRRAASAARVGSAERMRCTSGQKPMSSMRSASSSTSTSRPVKLDRIVPHVIHQPARRGDDDVHARPQRPLLRVHRHAAVDRDARNRRVVRQPLHLVFDLDRELARRRQHQRARSGGRSGGALGEEPLQDRHEERGRLAGARLGAGDHVVAGEGERDDAALHGRVRVQPRSRIPLSSRASSAGSRTGSEPGRSPTARTRALAPVSSVRWDDARDGVGAPTRRRSG